MRYSPFFPDNTQVRVKVDVNRPKEKGQPVMEETQLRSAQQTATHRTGSQEFWIASLRDLVHRGGKLSGGQTRRGEKVAVHEYFSDVCDEVVNDEEHKNQCGLLASVMESRLSPSPALTRIQCSRHVQGVLRWVERTERTRTPWRRLRWRRRRPQQRTQLPRTPRQGLGQEDRRVRRYQCL